MVYSSLRTAIRNSVLVALSEYPTAPVIFSHQKDGTEPVGTYATISILSTTQQGHHTTSSFVDLQEKLTIQAFYEVLVQISFTGSQSGDMAYSFNQRINNNPLVFEELARNKLGVMRKTPVRRAPQKRDTQWVEYHNMDVTFSYNVVTEQLIDIVEGITVEGNYETSDGLFEYDFTVPENLVILPPTP